jgi:hypothetical protein
MPKMRPSLRKSNAGKVNGLTGIHITRVVCARRHVFLCAFDLLGWQGPSTRTYRGTQGDAGQSLAVMRAGRASEPSFSEHRINVEIIKFRLDGGKLGVKLRTRRVQPSHELNIGKIASGNASNSASTSPGRNVTSVVIVPGSSVLSISMVGTVGGALLCCMAPQNFSRVGAAMVWPMRVNKKSYVIEASAGRGKFECDWEEAQICWTSSPANPKAALADL